MRKIKRGSTRNVQRPSSAGSPRRSNSESAVFFRQKKEWDVPSSVIKNARQTGILNLSGKGLAQVPDRVWTISELCADERKSLVVSLDEDLLSDNGKWWEYKELSNLNLSCNTITQISPKIANLEQLKSLNLSDNSLSDLPVEISELHHLETLILSRNHLDCIPKGILQLPKLRTLRMQHNHITEIPDEIADLHMLAEMDMSHNCISSLPVGIGFLSRITTLSLHHNQLTELPGEIGCMTGLDILDVDFNSLTSFPLEVNELCHLKQLLASHNAITHIPLLHGCLELKEVHMAYNKLTEVSEDEVDGLIQIEILDLGDNRISSLPENIHCMQSLQRLILINNSLTSLPSSLGLLGNLLSVRLEGNPLKSVRRDLVLRGTLHLLQYLRDQLPEDSDEMREVVAKQRPGSGRNRPLSGNRCASSLPLPDIYEMKRTHSLVLANRGLENIPAVCLDAAKEANVTIVDLGRNEFQEIPQSLIPLFPQLTELSLPSNHVILPATLSLPQLLYLNLSCNQLEDFPAGVSVPLLREINLCSNRLRHIPGVLKGLRDLEIVDLADNQIEKIDMEVFNCLPRLATLALANNNIDQVPPELGKLNHIRHLTLEGNCFRTPRPAVLSKGTDQVLSYLRDRIPT